MRNKIKLIFIFLYKFALLNKAYSVDDFSFDVTKLKFLKMEILSKV